MTDATTHLRTEIGQQAEVIGRLVEASGPLRERMRATFAATDIDHVMLVARGSSDNVARYGQYLLGITCRLPVSLATPSLQSIYGVAPRLDRSLVVAISQSGRSPDVVGVLASGREQGRPTIAITNEPASPLAAVADHVIDLAAGEERAVAATKTYTSSLVAMALLAVALGDPAEAPKRLRDLAELPEVVEAVLAATPVELADRLVDTRHLLVTGRGLNYATAFEAALKIRELTGTVAEAFSPPDLLHGPIAALEAGAAALVIAPTEPSVASQRELVPVLRERGALLAIISADQDLLQAAALPFPLVREPAPWLTPVTSILPAQLLAARLASVRGMDLDRPTGLTKVTETR
ncbi:MAG: SIS domain-containing protein [Nitriliruptor sp.]|uniref:SIS domain-containing protein n=1 Tax=Nitriliruptor sp. TaxID=2448056 RepID=UPI0034A0A7FB